MEDVILTDFERDIVQDRLLFQLPAIERSDLSEAMKLEAIGAIVSGTIVDLHDPLYGRSTRTVSPSILPKHDDTTIDKMAQWQRILRESGLTPEEQALGLDQLETFELGEQRSNRSPLD